jgi:ankyrin repeat protein
MALHAAAYAGHKDMVTFLLEVGANVNSPTVRSPFPLSLPFPLFLFAYTFLFFSLLVLSVIHHSD